MSLADRSLRHGRGTLLIFISGRHIEWQCVDTNQPWLPQRCELLADIPVADPVAAQVLLMPALLAALQQITAAPGTIQMRVVLADNWLAAAPLPWSAAMNHTASAIGFALEQLLTSGYAIDADATVRLDNAAYGAPRLALAYPAQLLDGLQQCARRLQLSLRSVMPLSLLAWNALHDPKLHRQPTWPALAIIGDDVLVLARSGSPDSSRLLELTVRTGDAAVQRHAELENSWRRLCLRQPQWHQVQQVAVLEIDAAIAPGPPLKLPFVAVDLGLSANGDDFSVLRLASGYCRAQTALDAIAAVSPVNRWHWPLLIGVLAAVLTLQAIATGAERNALRSQWQASRNASSQLAAPVRQQTLWQPQELPRIAAVNLAIRQLNLPLTMILQALTPPPDIRVAVLSVETAGGTSGTRSQLLKIVAAADSSADMARYVAYLDEHKPLMRAYLTQHEITPGATGTLYRFTTEVAWSE